MVFYSQISDLQRELEEVRDMAAQYEKDIAEESQGQSMELMGSQMDEYLKLKEQAAKQATVLQMDFDKVRI